MTNNTTKDQIIALFPDNADNEISASDMRVYTEAIFNDKEVKVVKIQYIANLAAESAEIYEGSIVVIWGDENTYNGLYLSKVNQPTVTSELIKLSGLIENPEDANNPLLTYDNSDLVPPVTLNTDTYTEVLRLITPPRVAGLYEVKMAMVYTYDNISRPAYFRWSEDGGQTWFEILEEPKDVLNVNVNSFFHPEPFGGGIKDIIIEARCDRVSDTLVLLDMHVVFQRVK